LSSKVNKTIIPNICPKVVLDEFSVIKVPQKKNNVPKLTYFYEKVLSSIYIFKRDSSLCTDDLLWQRLHPSDDSPDGRRNFERFVYRISFLTTLIFPTHGNMSNSVNNCSRIAFLLPPFLFRSSVLILPKKVFLRFLE
jgi:hypothetical protein